jgi:hypothetical protein
LIPDADRITEMFHAMHSHRGIITEKRQTEFRLLLVPGKIPLPAAMDAVEAIEGNTIQGDIEIRPERTVSAWSVLKSSAGMISGYLCRTIRETLERLERVGSLEKIEETEHGAIRRLVAALGLIEPLMRLDRRWILLGHDHVEDLLDKVTKLYAAVPEQDRSSFPLVDLEALATWRDEVVEGV